MANAQRRRRVADEIQRVLADIIHLELKDPRVGLVTLTGVEVSQDLAHAKIFFSRLGNAEEQKQAELGLRSAAGFLRVFLGRQIKVRNTPELHFIYDASIESGMRISNLIDEALAPQSGKILG